MFEHLESLYQLSQRYLSGQYKKYKRDFLKNNEFENRLNIFVGQRGIGKTTILVQYLLEQVNHEILSQKILYIPVDHVLLTDIFLYDVAQWFEQNGGQIIVFDEIHTYPNWSKELKSIYDTFPKLKIFASGSSALEIHKGSHDLTRRAVVYKINGLSFREYLEINSGQEYKTYELSDLLTNANEITHNILTKLESSGGPNQKILPVFKNYLKMGYYPYSLEFKNIETYLMTLEQNLSTTIESDLVSIYPVITGHSVRKMKQLLAFIASEVPFVLSLEKLKRMLDIGDIRTLKSYLKYLSDAGLISLLPKASNKISKIETPEKIYLHNPNQLYAISASTPNIGTVRELFFLNMLAVKHELSAPKIGDFLVDGKFLFEIGGRKKGFEQIKNKKNSFIVADDIERVTSSRIPLWVFGFLY
jgi:uncharacterized protein